MAADHLANKQFKPGQSGNPGGRPKCAAMLAKLREETKDGVEIVEFLLGVMRNDGGKWNERNRLFAAVQLLERIGGKAPQTIDLTVTNEKPESEIDWDKVPLEKRQALLGALSALEDLTSATEH